MNKNILGVFALLVAILIYPFFARPLISDVNTLRQDTSDIRKTIDKVENFISITNRLAKQVEEFSQPDLNRLSQILPKDVETLPLIVDIQNVALNNGLLISGGVDVSKISGSDNVSDSKPYDTVTLNFNLVGRYSSVKNFLDELASSLTLLDIAVFSFASNENGLYAFRVVIHTYELPDEIKI